MKKVLGLVLATIAAAVSTAATTGCTFAFFDEPKMFE